MPHQDHRNAVAFAFSIRRPATSRPADRPGGRGEIDRAEGLDRVDHADVGPLRPERGEHGPQVGLGDHRHGGVGAQALGAGFTCAGDSSPVT